MLVFLVIVEIARNLTTEPQARLVLGLVLVIGVTLALIYLERQRRRKDRK
jgi:hypothetical protein